MPETVNHSDAMSILIEAYTNENKISDGATIKIESVLRGGHKTFKYILVNGLLAKATNPKVNPIALQAGAEIDGAFDARSLCHKVLVPFERDVLKKALGGSNEPFLNKPARFQTLSPDNAVRSGDDSEAMSAVIDVFRATLDSKIANAYLSFALSCLKVIAEEQAQLQNVTIKHEPTLVEIIDFIKKFITKSFEGETCAIVIGTLERLFYQEISEGYVVKPHKVNQSGASSKEAADIDVFNEDELVYGIEVKDKDFTAYDLEHAFNKIAAKGSNRGEFIYGPNASFNNDDIRKKLLEFESAGFYTHLDFIIPYSRIMLFKINIQDKEKFIKELIKVSVDINCKDATTTWIHELLKEVGWT